MEFIMRRSRTVASVHGHAISFVKDQPTFVPPDMHREVLELGAEPAEAMAVDPRDPVPVNGIIEPTDPLKRGEDIHAAIELITTKNAREDFTGNGAPHVKALTAILGWKPTNNERDVQWTRFQTGDD